MDEEPQGRVDLASVLYIACGIPGIVVFLVVTFWFARSCGFSVYPSIYAKNGVGGVSRHAKG